MKAQMMKRILHTILFFTFSLASFAQLSVPFKVRYQGFVKGDMTVIANNIVNRVDYNNGSNQPYYNHTNSAKLNDEFDMEYIDIDEDDDTFSSSSAELLLDQPNRKKIVYAALYWSATYKYESGIQKNEDKFVAENPARTSFSNIKLKLPNQEKYVDISGQIVFDGKDNKDFKEFAPYVVYADITNYVKKLSSPAGIYTVANVKATQGKLSGGVAAGWTLFIVYEDDSMSGKNITSYDGFAGASEKPIDILYTGYETPKSGTVSAKIAFATLDGDCNVAGDQLLFSANNGKTFSPLSNTLRKDTNFFNSCITIENKYFLNRFPDSKNTLGYDTALFTIPNANNSLIPNGNNQSTLRLKTSGDKLGMFFNAFSIETMANTNETAGTVDENILVSNDDNILKVTTLNGMVKFVQANNDLLNDGYKTTSSFNRVSRNKNIDTKKRIIEIQTLNASKIEDGYYIVANIYKTEDDAKKFVTYLGLKHIDAAIFSNSLNNYKYVYLKKTESQKEAIYLYITNMNDSYDERMQILAVNKSNIELISEAKDSGKTKEPYDIQSAIIPNESSAFYIVANVFLHEENATKFMDQLKASGLTPHLLVNPQNNYNYVYLEKVLLEQNAISLYLSKLNNTYLGKIWILSVNNNNRTITSNDD
jgi:hypothetical protein